MTLNSHILRALVLFAVLLALISGTLASSDLYYRTEGSRHILGNSHLELAFSTSNGALVSLKLTTEGEETEFLGSGPHGLFRLFLDKNSLSSWTTELGIQINGAETPLASSEWLEEEQKITLKMEWRNLGGQTDLNAIAEITVRAYNPISEWHLTIDNQLPVGVISIVHFPSIEGLDLDLPDNFLTWPKLRGQIIQLPGDGPLRPAGQQEPWFLTYPVPGSMQWMRFGNQDHGVYLASLDTEGRYKEFIFGRWDPNVHHQMTIAPWIFLEPGMTWTSPPAMVGLLKGTWHLAADHYRNWLIDEAGWVREHAGWVETWPGWDITFIADQDEVLNEPYSAIPGHAEELGECCGYDSIGVFGWHEWGFDTMYPRYEYRKNAGGRHGLSKAISDTHDQGDQVILYMNPRLMDVTGSPPHPPVWYLDHGDTHSVKPLGGSYIPEVYGTRTFHVQCASDPVIRENYVDYVTDLVRISVDGIWFDQLSCATAFLCYDADHGHSDPATSFGPGIMGLLDRMRAILGPERWISTEGVVDQYGRYLDVHGNFWLEGYDDPENPPYTGGRAVQDAPELVSYTLPARMMGVGTEDYPSRRDHHAWAFCMGQPFVGQGSWGQIKRYIEHFYNVVPDVFYRGLFRDTVGITGSAPRHEVMAKLLTSSDGGQSVVTFWNRMEADRDTHISVDLEELSFGGSLSGTNDVESDLIIQASILGRTVEFDTTIDGQDVRAVKITLGPPDSTPPEPVEGLIGQKALPDEIEWSWQPVTFDTSGNPETVNHYVIYRADSPDFSDGEKVGISFDTLYVTEDRDLADGKMHFYLVSAVDAGGNEGSMH